MTMVLHPCMAHMTPSEATLFLSDQCNFRCAGCKRQIGGTKNHPEMSVDIVERLLEVYPAIKGICVAGLGEPTLCPRFGDIVNYLLKKGIYIGIVTNGSNVEKILALVHKPGYVSVSLYGYDRGSYLRTVGIDAFENVMENFRTLRKHLPSLGLSYYVNKNNYSQLPEIISLANELGADFLNITNYLVYDVDDKDELDKIITTGDTSIIESIESSLAQLDMPGARPVYVDPQKYIFRCPSYRKLINVNGAGEIGACQRQIIPSAEYGNIFDVKDWYGNGKILDCRNMIMAGQYPHENCRFCFGKMGLSQNVELSIGVFILFHEKVLQTIECIHSFLQFDVPIYVLNNGSSDKSTMKLNEDIKNYSNVQLVQAPQNLGVGVGRNYLIEKTKEEWLFFVDNDITIQSVDLIESIIAEIKSNPDVEVFIPKLYNVHEEKFVNHLEMFVEGDEIRFRFVSGNITNYFPGGASIVNRRVFQRCGLYDEEMFVGLEDMELGLRAVMSGVPIKGKYIDEIILFHNHKVVESSDDKRAVLTRYNINVQEKSYKRILQKYPELKFDHAFKPWVVEQQTKMTQSNHKDLTVLTPHSNFGAGTFPRYNVELSQLFVSEKLLLILDGLVSAMADAETNLHIVGSTLKAGAFSCPTALLNQYDFCNGPQLTQKKNSDFRSYRDWELFENEIAANSENLILAVLALERLYDPRPFLRSVRNSLLMGARCVLIVDLLDVSDYHPTMDTYWRQWTFAGLKVFLELSGFICKIVRAEDDSRFAAIELKTAVSDYDLFLETLYLPCSSIEYLVVSQEHSTASLTGGIGTYVGELERVVSGKTLGVMLTGVGELLPDIFVCKQHKYISPFLVLGEAFSKLRLEDSVKQTLDVVIYLYSNLKVIEFQDVNGKGYQFLQAKSAGLYPTDLMTQVVCHASRVSLEKSYNVWIDPSDRELYEEKYVIEKSDVSKYPTKYIHDYYKSVGYDLEANINRIERLPFIYNEYYGYNKDYVDVDTLIFFGKRSYYKGFKLFTDVVRKLLERCHPIRRILLVGPRCDEMDECNRYFSDFSGTDLTVEEYSLGRKKAVELIADNAGRSICIIPYLADNHPYSILEVVDSFCPIIATTTGGIPELFPPQFSKEVLFSPDSEYLVCGLENWFKRSGDERAIFMRALREAIVREQCDINTGLYGTLLEVYAEWYEKKPKKSKYPNDVGVTSLVIVAPNNKGLSLFLPTIRNQYHASDRVVFLIRSSSSQSKIEEAIRCVKEYGYECLLTEGEFDGEMLNEGLQLVDTSYVTVFHTTIHLATTCISAYVRQMQTNPTFGYVSSYAGFQHDQNNGGATFDNIKNYLGEGIIISQTVNHLGHPYGLYKTECLRQCGGFVSTDDVARGGWATIMRIASKGYKTGIDPQPVVTVSIENIGYGDEYPEQHCLAVETYQIDRFESFRVQSICRWLDIIKTKNVRLNEEYALLKTEYCRLKNEKYVFTASTIMKIFKKGLRMIKRKYESKKWLH